MNHPLKFAIVLVFVLMTCEGQLSYGDVGAIADKTVDSLVQPYLDGEIVNAVSIGIVQGDKTRSRHYGRLLSESLEKPTDRTLYEIGSMTKVFTGILLAHAVETGRVKLDQPIGSLMRELQEVNKDVGDSILLQHLATHTSGLPRVPSNMKPAQPDPYADYDRKQLTEFMCQFRPERKPGVESEYSNLGVGLLGDLLAAEAGGSYEELLVKNIVQPLAMSDTRVTLSEDQRKRLASPHNADQSVERNWHFDALAGAGAIRSTTADMLRFLQANLNPPVSPLGKAIELAWKQHLPAKGHGFAMGLGWHIARDGQTRWHNGQTAGYHSMMLVNRPLDIGVVLLCNTSSDKVDALAESIIQTMAGMNVEPAKFAKEKKVPADIVARLQGRYQLVPTFILTARADGQKLFVKATDQPEFRVYAEGETEWKCRVVDARLTFELPETGNATAVTLHQFGRDMRAPRIGD